MTPQRILTGKDVLNGSELWGIFLGQAYKNYRLSYNHYDDKNRFGLVPL